MIKGFRQIAGLTVISRVFGMIRDMAFAYYFGAGWLMTAWTVGFKIPNLTRRLFGEGAAAAAFIPIYSEQLVKDPKAARDLANTVTTVIFVILAGFVLIGEIGILLSRGMLDVRAGTKTGMELTAIMMPYMVGVCVVAILAGILNVHRHFAMPAAAPIALNITIISALVITGRIVGLPGEQQVFYAAAAVLLAGVIQIVMQLIPLRRAGVKLSPAWKVHSPAFKKVIFLMGPMILGLTVTQLNTLADDVIALSFMRADGFPLNYGAPSYLYYAQRLYQFPLGVLGISLATAIFPVMSGDAARGDMTALKGTINKGLRATFFVALPAAAGLVLVARPLVALLFERGQFTDTDTAKVSWTLGFYALGLMAFFAQQIVIRAFYSLQNSKLPAVTAIIAVVLNVILNLTLIWPLATGGLALSTSVCAYTQVIILTFLLRRKLGAGLLSDFGRTVIHTIIATVIMTIVTGLVLLAMKGLEETTKFDILRLVLAVPIAAGTYYVTARFLKSEELSLVHRRTGK